MDNIYWLPDVTPFDDPSSPYYEGPIDRRATVQCWISDVVVTNNLMSGRELLRALEMSRDHTGAVKTSKDAPKCRDEDFNWAAQHISELLNEMLQKHWLEIADENHPFVQEKQAELAQLASPAQ
jgi:hypothetical protein